MFGRVQSLAESDIGRLGVDVGVRLIDVIQGATSGRHHKFSAADFPQSPPRCAVIAASVYAATREL